MVFLVFSSVIDHDAGVFEVIDISKVTDTVLWSVRGQELEVV
jgi:hypothetical protein